MNPAAKATARATPELAQRPANLGRTRTEPTHKPPAISVSRQLGARFDWPRGFIPPLETAPAEYPLSMKNISAI